MFSMCVDRGCLGTGEIEFCSVCVLIDGALLQRKVSYVLYVYLQRVRSYRGDWVFSVCVLIDGALLQRKVSYVLYVY